MEALDAVVPVPQAGRTVAPTRRVWLRERSSTPGRLALIATLLVLGAVCFGAVGAIAEQSRARAAQTVRTRTEPLLVAAGALYTSVSDANATVARAFLRGGLEPPATREQYLKDVRRATASLAILAIRGGGSRGTRSAVMTLGEELPIYAGLVETARANNREALPVGAAYLREASALLRRPILPAASHLYADEAHRLAADYSTGTGSWQLIALAVVTVASVMLLILAQRYVSRVSRRIFNVPMLLATVVIAGVAAWAFIGVVREQDALASARRDSDAVEVMSASRILLSRAQSDESLTLVSRGSDTLDAADLAQVERKLSGPSGLIAETAAIDSRAGARAVGIRLQRDYASFVRAPSSAATAARLNANLALQIAIAQSRFTAAAGHAAGALSGLPTVIPAVAALACLLALFGIWQRLEEYR